MNNERVSQYFGEDQVNEASPESTDATPKGTSGGQAKKPRQNPREFDDARYAALMCRAHSEQACSLVNALTDLVAAHELATGRRTNKRKKKQAALSSAVERLLADLLLAQTSEKINGYVFRSMRPGGFSESEVGYRVFKSLVDTVVSLGLLEHHKGFQHWRESFGGQKLPMIRKATRFRATQKLLDICDQHGVRAADFHQHFLIPLPEHPLQLRAAAKRNEYGDKIRGRPMRFEATAHTEKLEKQLKELNTFFDGFELKGGLHRGYLRIFNKRNVGELSRSSIVSVVSLNAPRVLTAPVSKNDFDFISIFALRPSPPA